MERYRGTNGTKPLTVRTRYKIGVKEKAFIFNNYTTMSASEMARRIGRSSTCVLGFMHKYNLPFKDSKK